MCTIYLQVQLGMYLLQTWNYIQLYHKAMQYMKYTHIKRPKQNIYNNKQTYFNTLLQFSKHKIKVWKLQHFQLPRQEDVYEGQLRKNSPLMTFNCWNNLTTTIHALNLWTWCHLFWNFTYAYFRLFSIFLFSVTITKYFGNSIMILDNLLSSNNVTVAIRISFFFQLKRIN